MEMLKGKVESINKKLELRNAELATLQEKFGHLQIEHEMMGRNY